MSAANSESQFLFTSVDPSLIARNRKIINILQLIFHHLLAPTEYNEIEIAKRISEFLMQSPELHNEDVFHLLRLMVTGSKNGPNVVKTCAVLGQDEICRRIDRFGAYWLFLCWLHSELLLCIKNHSWVTVLTNCTRLVRVWHIYLNIICHFNGLLSSAVSDTQRSMQARDQFGIFSLIPYNFLFKLLHEAAFWDSFAVCRSLSADIRSFCFWRISNSDLLGERFIDALSLVGTPNLPGSSLSLERHRLNLDASSLPTMSISLLASTRSELMPSWHVLRFLII